MKLIAIAEALPAKLVGNASLDIRRVVHPRDAEGPGDLAIALSKEALTAGGGERAGAVLVATNGPVPTDGRSALVYAGNERVALAVLTRMFDPGPSHAPGIHPTAIVAPDAVLGRDAAIGPYAVVGARTVIGEGTTVLARVTIGAGVRVGAGGMIHSGVVLADGVILGDRVIVHPNAVIGADGFSFLPAQGGGGQGPGAPTRVHSLGTVIVGDDVEIGAGATIDRATLRATRIGRGTKIDNQVQIGHNTVIGESCLVCGQAGIAGSCEIGDRVLIAAGVGISDHVRIGSDAAVMAMSGVGTAVPAGAVFGGLPAVAIATWKERYMQLGRLKSLYRQVDDLKQRLEALEKAGGAR